MLSDNIGPLTGSARHEQIALAICWPSCDLVSSSHHPYLASTCAHLYCSSFYRCPPSPRTTRPIPPAFAVTVPPIAIRRPAGSSCTSKANPTSAACSMAGCMATEIAGYVRCFAAQLSSKDPAGGWKLTRAPRQRPVPPQVRQGVPRRDEGHRRRGRGAGATFDGGRST